MLITIFQRGAVDGLEHDHSVRRAGLLRVAADAGDRETGHRRQHRRRPERILRHASADASAQAALGVGPHGDRPCLRLPRRDALALRRAGLHGVGHAGREEHVRRLDEPLPAREGASEGDAVPRRGARAAAAARAAGHGAGAGDRADLAVRDPRRPVDRNGAVLVRGGIRGGGEQRPALDGARGVRRGEDAEEGGSVAVRAVERRRISAVAVRAGAAADRAARQGRRRPRGGVCRVRQLGPPRQRGCGGRRPREPSRRSRRGASRRSSAISATACRTSS